MKQTVCIFLHCGIYIGIITSFLNAVLLYIVFRSKKWMDLYLPQHGDGPLNQVCLWLFR